MRPIALSQRSILALAAALAGAPLAAACAQHAIPAPAAERVTALLAPYDSATFPGCVVGATRDGRLVFEHAFGAADLASGVALSPVSVLGVGSISKQFTAAAIALLVQDGLVALDDDVRRWIPELPAFGDTIRVGHLLYHTSGLRDYLSLLALSGRSAEARLPGPVILDQLARQRGLNHPPGTRFGYSNTNYLLLAMLVERVSGMPFTSFAASRVFAPLGMHQTRFARDGEVVAGQAESYRQDADGRLMEVALPGVLSGDGGAYSTLRDLALWEANLLAPRLGRRPRELVDLLRSPGRDASGRPLRYGWGNQFDSYRGVATEGHGGTWGGYRAYFLRLPALRFGAIVLCNQLEFSPFQISRRLADHFVDVSLDSTVPTPGPLRASPGPPSTAPAEVRLPEDADALVGRYESPELGATYRISVTPAGMWVTTTWTAPIALEAPHPDTLRAPGMAFVVRRDAAGAVIGLTLDADRATGIEFVRVPERP